VSSDFDPFDAAAEMGAADDFDPCADVYCPKCGLDWPGCGCTNDPHTYWHLACGTCGAKVSASYSPNPPQRPCHSCGQLDPMNIERRPMYAPVGVIA
jgi:hypothetical protein